MEPLVLPLAATKSLLGPDLLLPLGAAAAALALLGMLLILPLHVAQRREIARLRAWREREPQAGDPSPAEDAVTLAPAPSGAAAATARPLSAAERVTSERPALARIGTAERAALAPQPFWRRVVNRGPRHPLVITVLSVVAAAAIFAAAALLLRARSGESGGGASRGGGVDVVVVNASSSAGLAGDVADQVERSGYSVAGTGAAETPAPQSLVRYARGERQAGEAVARRLEIGIVQPFNPAAEAAADGADVVVVAGEDRTRAPAGRR